MNTCILDKVNLILSEIFDCIKSQKNVDINQEGRGINRKNLNANLETPHLAPAIFSHLPGFYLKTVILNLSPFLFIYTFILEKLSQKLSLIS